MNIIPDNIDFSQYMEETEQHAVYPASHWTKATKEAFYPPADQPVLLPPTMLWKKTHDKVNFRPGEVSLWAGVNGHGKSMFLSQVTLDLNQQHQRTMVASFEMRPVRQMMRMSRQAYGDGKPSIDFIDSFGAWNDSRLWLYDHVGAVEWRKVIAVMRYARKQFGITQFVVDSLMKCVKGEDDYNAQKDFVNALCAFANDNMVHVHLVHHVRKGESEHKAPGKFDIKGAGAITDLVDNVFIVWRDKKAEDDDTAMFNAQLVCEKQRNGEFEGRFGFWFDVSSQQYLDTRGTLPIRYELK